jgi:hypothetical protein
MLNVVMLRGFVLNAVMLIVIMLASAWLFVATGACTVKLFYLGN